MIGKLPFTAAAALAAAVLCPAPGFGEDAIYRFTDEGGVTHFTNVPTDLRYRPMVPEDPPPPPLSGDAPPYGAVIEEVAGQYGVDANLLRAVIKCESNFNRHAVSRAGAQGLMQLMPETAKLVEVGNPFNADENIQGGTRYLKYLLDSFGDWELALAAYNAGEGAVRRHGGIPPYRETRNYVKAVMAQYKQYCRAGIGQNPVTAADLRSFVNNEGVHLYTNVPWKYRADKGWRERGDP